MQQPPQRRQPAQPASAVAPTALQELQTLIREFLEQTPPAAESAADDEREAEEDKSAAADNPLAVAISIVYRLCTIVLDRAPSALESRERARALWIPSQQRSLMQHTLCWLDAAVTAGHPLSHLLVRLLSVIVSARVAEATFELLRPLPGSGSDPPSTFLQLLSGMLRLSEAPWMLRECIELMAVMIGVDELQRTMLLARDVRAPLEIQQTKQARAAFVAAFLAPSGRSILSLVRHWSHEALSEETRLTLMRVVVALASTPAAPAATSSAPTTLRMQHQQQQLQQQQPSPSIPARRILALHRDKWSASLLPPLLQSQSQSLSSDEQSCRRAQIQCIRELAAIIELTDEQPVAAAAPTRSTITAAAATAAPLAGGMKKTMASRLPQSHAHAGANSAAAAIGVAPMLLSSRAARNQEAAASAATSSIQSQPQPWSAAADPFSPAPSTPASSAALFAAYDSRR